MGKVNARAVGHAYERELRLRYRSLGFPDVETSRFASKMRDDAGVDLVNTGPLNLQAKRTKNQPNFRKVLAHMPEEEGQHNIIYHKVPNEGELVVMRREDFEEIVVTLMAEGIWKP